MFLNLRGRDVRATFTLLIFAFILSAFVIYTRLKFHAHYLYSWDSISFALSVEKFDLHLHQPHPPGYILYSYTLRFLNYLVQDPNRTMIYMNILATIGACFFVAKLVRLLSGSQFLAGASAALYAVNPVVIFYGSVAEIYAIEGFWVALIAYLLLSSRDRSKKFLWASIMMAIAGGFRPTTEIFLVPLWIATAFFVSRKWIFGSLAALMIGNLLWFVPLVTMSGGWNSYVDSVRGQSERVTESGSDDQATSAKIPFRLIQAITPPILIALLLRVYRIRLSRDKWLLLLAILPPIIFFLMVTFPKDGYLLVFLPLLIVMSVVLFGELYSSNVLRIGVLSVACILSWLSFVYPLRSDQKIAELTRPNLEIIQTRMNRLKQFFEITDGLGGGGRKTFVLETRHFFPNWRTLMYYFPEDTVYLVFGNKRAGYMSSHHSYETIQPPLRIPANSVLVTVGRTRPELPLESFEVQSFRYFFSRADLLPKRFQLYSVRCVVR